MSENHVQIEFVLLLIGLHCWRLHRIHIGIWQFVLAECCQYIKDRYEESEIRSKKWRSSLVLMCWCCTDVDMDCFRTIMNSITLSRPSTPTTIWKVRHTYFWRFGFFRPWKSLGNAAGTKENAGGWKFLFFFIWLFNVGDKCWCDVRSLWGFDNWFSGELLHFRMCAKGAKVSREFIGKEDGCWYGTIRCSLINKTEKVFLAEQHFFFSPGIPFR